MIADTLTITAVVAEFKGLTGARIDRIYQPSRYELLIYLYHAGEKKCLLLSAHPGRSRIHFTEQSYRHPEQPTSFCMLLRKYLAGGIILKIEQPPVERIVEFTVRSMDGIFTVNLVAEIMGRRSNLILVDRERQILGALKHIGLEQNPHRSIFPGEIYLPPPVPEKINPYDLNREQLVKKLTLLTAEGKTPTRALLESVLGISPLAAAELLFRSGWNREQREESARRLVEETEQLFLDLQGGRLEPCWALPENKYAPYRLTHLSSPHKSYAEMNGLLDDYYRHYTEREKTGNLRQSLLSHARKNLTRAERRLSRQQQDLKRAEDQDRLRLYGETLLTYARQVPPGAVEVELPNPYRPEQSLEIPLDPRLPAAGNAQCYFKRYRKAKITGEKARRQVRITRADIKYWQQVLAAVEKGDYDLLEIIRQELKGPAQRPAAARKKAVSLPLTFRSADGNSILVGRNRRQNDLVTFKLSTREDTWLHARGLPGSHVLIKGAPYPPPAELLEEAALLAAHFSKGKESTTVDVDYTAVKFVRRSPGGKAGNVLYTNYRTITVRPDSKRLGELLSQNNG